MSANPKYYFGLPDATREAKNTILPNHVQRDFETNIKFGDRSEGTQIIVGIKGSGKSALRRYIEGSESSLVWNLDCDHRYLDIDASSLEEPSGVLKNSLALYLLRRFNQFLLEEAKSLGLSGTIKSRLKRGNQKVIDTLKNVPHAIDAGTPFGRLNLHELLKSKAAPYIHTAWRELQEDMLPALKSRRVYIMIDDVEDCVFPAIQKNPAFIEGLARAVHDINDEYGGHLHVLLFFKYALWRKWYEHQREYDKVEHVIQQVSWNHNALCEVIARRISTIHNMEIQQSKKPNIEQLWAIEYDWGTGINFEEFTQEITKYCVSGPRDMIGLANKAKNIAGQAKITHNHIEIVLKEFSENKVEQLGADFGDVYPNIHRFVEKVFQGVPEEMRAEEYADWIDKKAMLNKKVDPDFASLPWYSSASKERLTKLMYDIGLLGKRTGDGKTVYAMEKPAETTTELMDSYLTVHPAFRPHLASRRTKKTKRKRKTQRKPS